MARLGNTVLKLWLLAIFAIVPGYSRFSGFYSPSLRDLQIVDTESPKLLWRETKIDPNWHVIQRVAKNDEELSDKLARMTFKKIIVDMIKHPMDYSSQEFLKELDILRL